MEAIVLTLALGMDAAAIPGVDRIVERIETRLDKVETRGGLIEQAVERHTGAVVDLVQSIISLGSRIFWGAVILGSMYLAGKVLDIVKVVVAAKYSPP